MVRAHKLHKKSGLAAAFVLFVLGVTGFFLDHDEWKFLYRVTIPTNDSGLLQKERRLWQGYWIHDGRKFACGYRGIYEGESRVLDRICLALRDGYAATDDGVYRFDGSRWKRFALPNRYITSLATDGRHIVAVEQKRMLYLLDLKGNIVQTGSFRVQQAEDISLGRFVRDLHYGRGLFDGRISLWINDYGALILAWLSLSGVLFWYLVKRKKGKVARNIVKLHANVFVILAVLPLVILAITGIFLDHAKALREFMHEVKIKSYLLPPVYHRLSSDIWSVDIEGNLFRVGSRYGVYKSENLRDWKLENPGFAYRMERKGSKLYVSGMGAPNRVYDGNWSLLPDTPHMFKQILLKDGKIYFLAHQSDLTLPRLGDITLYTLLLSLHDGSFFANWWIWINDVAALLLLLLLGTGIYRWMKRHFLRAHS